MAASFPARRDNSDRLASCRGSDLNRDMFRLTAVVGLVVWSSCAAFLFFRRYVIEQSVPSTWQQLAVIALAIVLLTLGLRIAWCLSKPHKNAVSLSMLSAIPAVMTAGVVTSLHDGWWPIIWLWVVLGLGEFVWWWTTPLMLRAVLSATSRDARLPGRSTSPSPRLAVHRPAVSTAGNSPDAAGPVAQGVSEITTGVRSADVDDLPSPTEAVADTSMDVVDQVVQRWTRSRAADGTESLAGTIRVDFAVGEDYQRVHVGFCPPLSRPPTVYIEPVGEPECEALLAQSFVHGARIDVQLDEPAFENCCVELEVYVVCEA